MLDDGLSRLTLPALNRAVLARQGLLDRLQAPLVEAVEAVGALQAQHWPALPVALGSRMARFAVADLYEALGNGELVVGTLLRGTLHLVSGREHQAYAAIVAAAGTDDWRRTDAEPGPEVSALRAALLSYARVTPRTGEEIAAFIEDWVMAHPEAIDLAELDQQRTYRWRPFLRSSSLVRAPGDGRWGTKTPAALRAAPNLGQPPTGEAALEEVILRHLRAFGPAGAEDVASWIGWRTPPVRAALDRLAPKLVRFSDEDGRALHDLPDAPRPDPATPAPPRLLAAFDSVLLAYAAKRRARILPDAHRDAIYERANLRIRPSFLIDGLVAGTWSVEVRRREAVLTLRPLERLTRSARAALIEEAGRLLGTVQPGAAGHQVLFES